MSTKLTEEQKQEIFDLVDAGVDYATLAEQYGVTKNVVVGVVKELRRRMLE